MLIFVTIARQDERQVLDQIICFMTSFPKSFPGASNSIDYRKRMAFILGSVILLLTVVPHQVFATTSRPSFSMLARKDNFVTVQGTSFKKNGKDLFLLSANYWQGANMGAVASAKGNRDQLAKDLDHLKSVGTDPTMSIYSPDLFIHAFFYRFST